jgi:CxxC motif-containing protein
LDVKQYTCIVCPRSCKIDLTIKDDNSYEIKGNSCKRGESYVINEYTNPKRMLTTTVKIENGLYKNIPVVSDQEVEKSKLFDCLKYLYSIKVKAPIKEGDIIVENILGTGVNIIAARDMAKK